MHARSSTKMAVTETAVTVTRKAPATGKASFRRREAKGGPPKSANLRAARPPGVCAQTSPHLTPPNPSPPPPPRVTKSFPIPRPPNPSNFTARPLKTSCSTLRPQILLSLPSHTSKSSSSFLRTTPSPLPQTASGSPPNFLSSSKTRFPFTIAPLKMPEPPRDREFPAPNTHEKKGSSSKLLLSILNILALSRSAAGADRLEDDVTRRDRDRSLPPDPRRRFSFGHEGGARGERRSGTQACFPIGCWFPYVTKRGGGE